MISDDNYQAQSHRHFCTQEQLSLFSVWMERCPFAQICLWWWGEGPNRTRVETVSFIFRDQKYLTLNFLWRNWIKEERAWIIIGSQVFGKIARWTRYAWSKVFTYRRKVVIEVSLVGFRLLAGPTETSSHTFAHTTYPNYRGRCN